MNLAKTRIFVALIFLLIVGTLFLSGCGKTQAKPEPTPTTNITTNDGGGNILSVEEFVKQVVWQNKYTKGKQVLVSGYVKKVSLYVDDYSRPDDIIKVVVSLQAQDSQGGLMLAFWIVKAVFEKGDKDFEKARNLQENMKVVIQGEFSKMGKYYDEGYIILNNCFLLEASG